jgi:hypothetical protein
MTTLRINEVYITVYILVANAEPKLERVVPVPI